MTIYDDDLNDITKGFLTKANREISAYKATIAVLMVAIIGVMVFAALLDRKADMMCKENHLLSDSIERDENLLTLEYSVGYWFINKPGPVNDSVLYDFLVQNGAWYPDILLKQAKIESGNYTSNVFQKSNNMYGMKKVGIRNTTQLQDTYCGYGCYTNWCLSALDRILWDIFYFNDIKPTEEDYMKAMEKYAETPNYTELLKQ